MKKYTIPTLIQVKLDNEIALILESEPPNPDNETIYGLLENTPMNTNPLNGSLLV